MCAANVDRRRGHFNPRPPWGGRRLSQKDWQSVSNISIHALRGEGDKQGVANAWKNFNFNPRPPWGGRQDLAFQSELPRQNFNPRPPWGGRQMALTRRSLKAIFQSTPSVGRATSSESYLWLISSINFNPRPPWGGRRIRHRITDYAAETFQSTPSVGRATNKKFFSWYSCQISIHALRGEGD